MFGRGERPQSLNPDREATAEAETRKVLRETLLQEALGLAINLRMAIEPNFIPVVAQIIDDIRVKAKGSRPDEESLTKAALSLYDAPPDMAYFAPLMELVASRLNTQDLQKVMGEYFALVFPRVNYVGDKPTLSSFDYALSVLIDYYRDQGSNNVIEDAGNELNSYAPIMQQTRRSAQKSYSADQIRAKVDNPNFVVHELAQSSFGSEELLRLCVDLDNNGDIAGEALGIIGRDLLKEQPRTSERPPHAESGVDAEAAEREARKKTQETLVREALALAINVRMAGEPNFIQVIDRVIRDIRATVARGDGLRPYSAEGLQQALALYDHSGPTQYLAPLMEVVAAQLQTEDLSIILDKYLPEVLPTTTLETFPTQPEDQLAPWGPKIFDHGNALHKILMYYSGPKYNGQQRHLLASEEITLYAPLLTHAEHIGRPSFLGPAAREKVESPEFILHDLAATGFAQEELFKLVKSGDIARRALELVGRLPTAEPELPDPTERIGNGEKEALLGTTYYSFEIFSEAGRDESQVLEPMVAAEKLKSAECITIGDLHASYEKLVETLVAGNLISLPDDFSQNFRNLSIELATLVSGSQPLDKNKYATLVQEINNLFRGCAWAGGDRKIRLIGDIFADRGVSDVLVESALRLIPPENVTILFGNHELEALRFCTSDFRLISHGQSASQERESGIWPEDWLNDIYYSRLKTTKLFDFDKATGTFYTHAPITNTDVANLRAFLVAKGAHLPKIHDMNESDLEVFVAYANIALATFVQNAEKGEWDSDFANLLCKSGTEGLVWSRTDYKSAEDLVLEDQGVKLFVHGHDRRSDAGIYGWGAGDNDYTILNLDQEVRKMPLMTSGNSKILVK